MLYTIYIDIEKRIGQRGFSDVSFAQLGPPGKVTPKLLVGQGLVGGIITHNAAMIFIVVFVIGKQLCLLHKNGLPGLPATVCPVFKGAGGADQRGNPLHRLLTSRPNDFVFEYIAVKPLSGFFHSVCIYNTHAPFVQMFGIIIHYFQKTVKRTSEISQEALEKRMPPGCAYPFLYEFFLKFLFDFLTFRTTTCSIQIYTTNCSTGGDDHVRP